MAKPRIKISPKMKEKLIKQAGGKCANPGCPTLRTEIHHIRQWAVYQTNDERHMIAICPTCHDAVHTGSLTITDEVLYQWKQIKRPGETTDSYLYIEPGRQTEIIMGSVGVISSQGVVIFELSDRNTAQFRVVDDDLMILNLSISLASGQKVLRVVENHIRHVKDTSIVYEQRAGRVRVTVPNRGEYVPAWVVDTIREWEPDFGHDQTLTLLDLEVQGPGQVRAKGIWVERDKAIVVTERALHFVKPNWHNSIENIGFSISVPAGHINASVFGF